MGDGNEGLSEEEHRLLFAQSEGVKEVHDLQERRAEFRTTSSQKRKVARQLLEEAERLDIEALDLQASSEAAEERLQSARFEHALLRLKRNDKDLTTLSLPYPSGYGKRLGEALLQNTVLTDLSLDPSSFLSSEGQVERQLEPILHVLQESKSLTSVGITRWVYQPGGDGSNVLGGFLLNAISRSQSIRDLKWLVHIPSLEFRHALSSTTSLVSLAVQLVEPDLYTDDDKQRIASTFAIASKTLESLTLIAPSADTDWFIQILTNLQKLRSLRDLCLHFLSEFDEQVCYDAVKQYLVSASGPLRRFELTGVEMNTTCITRVLSGLVRSPDGSTLVPSTSLSHLELSDCYQPNVNSVEQLAVFLQTRTTNNSGKITHDSALRKLGVNLRGKQSFSKRVAESVLMANSQAVNATMGDSGSTNDVLFPTIGSQLDALRVDDVHSIFPTTLCNESHRVRLTTLELCEISRSACIALSRCLPRLVSLRNLTLTDLENRRCTKWILRALRCNSSVCEVVTENESGVTLFDSTQLRLIQAYCDRNKALVPLIGTAPRNRSELCSMGAKLRPSLLLSTKPLTHTGASITIQGLLALGQSCGFD